jgi:hypothetical protein
MATVDAAQHSAIDINWPCMMREHCIAQWKCKRIQLRLYNTCSPHLDTRNHTCRDNDDRVYIGCNLKALFLPSIHPTPVVWPVATWSAYMGTRLGNRPHSLTSSLSNNLLLDLSLAGTRRFMQAEPSADDLRYVLAISNLLDYF